MLNFVPFLFILLAHTDAQIQVFGSGQGSVQAHRSDCSDGAHIVIEVPTGTQQGRPYVSGE